MQPFDELVHWIAEADEETGVRGEDEQFAALFSANYRQVVRTLWAYCGDLGVAEDAAQEAFARASRDWSRVSGMSSPAGWLHRVAYNEVNAHFRRARIGSRAFARLGQGPEERSADTDAAVSLQAAMALLPARQRAALSLHYLADLPIIEVARVMETREGTVKSLLSRGRDALRGHLGEPVISQERDHVQ